MLQLARMLDRGRLLLAIVLIVPLGVLMAVPSGRSIRPHQPVQAVAAEPAPNGDWVAQYDATGTSIPAAEPVTSAEILARFAAAGGTLPVSDGQDGLGLSSEANEGDATSELPAGYVSGGAPDAQLAATLRASQARNGGAVVPSGAGGNRAAALTTNPHVVFTRQSQIADLLSGGVDPRVVDLLTWVASRRGSITITSIRSDHSVCVAGSNPCRVSAHHVGRAVDIAAVNGEPCGGTPQGQCGQLYEEIVNSLRGTPYQPSQVIYGYDPWPAESWNFEMGNHHDHIHIGY